MQSKCPQTISFQNVFMKDDSAGEHMHLVYFLYHQSLLSGVYWFLELTTVSEWFFHTLKQKWVA